MEIHSPAFKNKERIPSKYTCEGDNISPPLEIVDIPENTKSLALIVDDPDAPSKTWVHWLVWNIPPTVSTIKEGQDMSEYVRGENDFGKLEYGGPCPPSGTHRYFFKVYALSEILDIKEGCNKEELLSEIEKCLIESAQLVGLYSKQK